MGGLISTLRFAAQTMKTMIAEYEVLSKRISLTPGIPQLNSSVLPPFWTVPSSPIAQHGKDAELPLSVDIIIIGSGITGTSIAKVLLDDIHRFEDASAKGSKRGEPLKVVMLEARDACSGATARNGGHIAPNIYNEYVDLRKTYGASLAQEILRFRLAHISSLIATAREENLLNESQARLVEGFDVFMHPDMFSEAKDDLKTFLKDVSKELGNGFDVIEDRESIESLQLVSSIVGCITKPGGAIHPYRFVTGILSNLLARYPSFKLFTRTPCTDIASTGDAYIVTTPRGEIRTKHVIHATNAWSSHLLPGMRRKIIPARTTMTAQRPGKGLSQASSWAGSRGFVFYPIKDDSVFEYLTQLLPSPAVEDSNPTNTSGSVPLPTSGEFMFGGRVRSSFMDNVGVVDDSVSDFENETHLGGALERYFASHWGEEGDDADTEEGSPPGGSWGKGRLKASWSGLLGLSADMQPWVGRVPKSVSGRREPSGDSEMLAAPGEWICAGYTGEGMVHAWLSGRALARMVLGVSTKDTDPHAPGLPAPFLITEKRVKKAKIENLIDRVGS
ncbi:FAD dependent oxidoreductase [Flammula alnicola]|nr:FAD dependent oxidoreductase [Flammula alnicola]